ncbi:MAG: GDP-mannose-dependent alpha-(1-6)-phosphatidylinositol monomannoside mannosyltransferase [Verrucomicrobia bacterium ADurb.Bin345]|nr:MAG: GDP-mannose-dependent alpha-(1-6)-phosphatidylinositol monomannoside mannosyltransferase [Verrucomicrobia bacterium ADurb.Bin345]
MNVWLLTNTPSPYQVEFFSAIGGSGSCQLSVRFLRQVHRGELWQPDTVPFDWRILSGIGPDWWSDAFRIHPQALREVVRGKHDLYILSGQYTSMTFLACACGLSLLRKPWVMWLEQPWPESYRPAWAGRLSSRSAVAGTLRRCFLKMLLRMARGVFCVGTVAMEAYRRMGAKDAKLHLLPYYCDLDRFARADPLESARIRARLGFLDKTVFLYSGALIKRKGVDLLLDAFQRLAAQHPEAGLILLGEGPVREELECSVQQRFAKQIHFAGHVAQSELPAWFKAADIFVFPSRHDGWGVVLNEACGAGLPIIAADSVGAARDLVRDNENGKLVPRDDVPRLAASMLFFLEQPETVKAFGERSRRIGGKFTLAKGVEQLFSNIRSCIPPGSSS